MTLPAIPLWAATSADLATLGDHGVVMLAAMLSTELRKHRHASSASLRTFYRDAREALIGGDAGLQRWANSVRESCGGTLSRRALYRRAVDEASRRGLVPGDADLRVAIDAALTAGRIDPEHLPVTLAEVWALATLTPAEGFIAAVDVKSWLTTAARVSPALFNPSVSDVVEGISANRQSLAFAAAGLPTALALTSGDLAAAIVEAGAQAERMREVVNMSAAEMRAWSEATFDPPAIADLETERPHAPPIGRGLARRLDRGRRRGR